MGQNGPLVLQFADDSIVFLPNSDDEIRNLRALLMFETIFGLQVNFPKSKMMVVGDVENLYRLAELLGCAVSSCPRTYLGLPLGGRVKSKHLCDPDFL